MDKKATKGYLVGYDGDERYRICIKENGMVICSRDVVFEEKPSITEDEISLPLQRFENKVPQDDESEVATDEDSKMDEPIETDSGGFGRYEDTGAKLF